MPHNKVLWVDNDPAYLYPYQSALEEDGYNVTVARTLSEAEELLLLDDLSLVILDVMMPVTDRDLALGYSPDMTSEGSESGLAFFRRHQEFLTSKQIPVIVLTVRIDRAITDDFIAAGLSPSNIFTKFEMCDVEVFSSVICATIEGTRRRAVSSNSSA